MENKNNNEKKILLSLLVSGIVGVGIFYAISAMRHPKTPITKKIGKTLSEVGKMLENGETNIWSEAVESIEKKMPKGTDVFNSIADWLSNGLSIWKAFKKGGKHEY